MQIQNNQSSLNFKGRIQFRDEKFISRTIDKMYTHEREKIERGIAQELQDSLPKVKKSFFGFVKKLFPKKDIVAPEAPKTLKDYWAESLDEMKEMVKTKLPNEYVLRNKNANLGYKSVSFQLTKADEYIFGVSTSVNNPVFPKTHIRKAVNILSAPEFKQNFDDLHSLIPDLTENKYLLNSDEFLSAEMLDCVKTMKNLKKKASAKDLNLSIELSKKEYGKYNQAKGIITDKNDKIIYQTGYLPEPVEGFTPDITRRLSQY